MRKENGSTRVAGTSRDETRRGGEQVSAAAEGRPTEERLSAAELDANLGALAGSDGERVLELPGLDAAAAASAKEPAETPPAQPLLDGSPEQLVGLGDLVIGLACKFGAKGSKLDVPSELGRLSDSERAILHPMAAAAGPQLAAMSSAASAYGHWIFLGTLGFIALTRYLAVRQLARALAPQAPGEPTPDMPASDQAPAATRAPAPGAPIPT